MKRILPLVLILAALSAISGFLVTKGTWIGRKGMRIFHKEYLFLNTWWEGTLVFFGTFLCLLLFHALIQRLFSFAIARTLHIILLLAALTGLYLNYYDFRHDFEHRIMGERFHVGFYLFWIGWIGICIFYILSRKDTVIKASDNKDVIKK